MPNDKSSAKAVLIAEYESLRSEINNRTTLAYTLIGLQIAAAGGGLAVLSEFADVLIGLAAVSSFLLLFWIDHAGAVYKVATYIALELSPHLGRVAHEPVLGWEDFLRRLNLSSDSARKALYGEAAVNQSAHIQATTAADLYTILLFGAPPPIFVVVFVMGADSASAWYIWVPALVVVALWAFSIMRFRSFRRMVEDLNAAILSHGARRDCSSPSGEVA